MTKSENAVRARKGFTRRSNVLLDAKGGAVMILLVAKTYARYFKISEALVYATMSL